MKIEDLMALSAWVCFLSYLLGSIPFGYIYSCCAKGIDIQLVGSGNIGATNVARKFGFGPGFIVASLDIWKAVFPVIMTRHLFPHLLWLAVFAAFAAFLGHRFPIWLAFKGGKGISVLAGGLLALVGWKIMLAIFISWLVIIFRTKIMSLANLIAVVILFVVFIIFILIFRPDLLYLFPLALFVVCSVGWAHLDNIKRLTSGKERILNIPSLRKLFQLFGDGVVSIVRKIEAF